MNSLSALNNTRESFSAEKVYLSMAEYLEKIAALYK